MLRDVAEGIAEYIRGDQVLADAGHITVVVEDKADFANEIMMAIAQLGVCVSISVLGFQRVPQSPIPQGTVKFEIVCHENPTMNREDLSNLTAQGVAERIAAILHWHKFPFAVGQMLFQDFNRDDVQEANIVRMTFEVNTVLGYEEAYFAEEKTTPNEEQ